MQNLIIKIASPSQKEVCIQREFEVWSGGSSRESFDRSRGDLIGKSGYWSKGKRRWVLVPKEDPETLEILSSCATHRRPCLIKLPSHPLQRSIIYGIAHVLTPGNYRRKGYAALLMTLLHQELNPKGTIPLPSRRNEKIVSPPIGDIDDDEEAEEGNSNSGYGKDAAATHLYSAIGDYYEPYGWNIVGIETTSWTIDQDQMIDEEKSLTNFDNLIIKEIFENDLQYFSNLNETFLISDLQNEPFLEDEEGNPLTESRIAILDPNGHAIRAKFGTNDMIAEKEDEKRQVFGASVLETEFEEKDGKERSWALWTIDFQRKELHFLRHRINKEHPEDFNSILKIAKRVANENKLETIKAWNVEKEILEKSGESAESKTEKRSDRLSSLCVYGNWGRDVEWWNNEYGCYC